MEKLKHIIEQHGKWSELTTYTDRIEAHIDTDFSHALENAKALLETIAKEICNSKGVELDESSPSINSLLRKAFSALGYSSSELVTRVSSALATIGQQVGELRNDIGATSHGRSLEELKERNSKVDTLTKEFLMDATGIVASFLIRTFEAENPRKGFELAGRKLLYTENETFNEFWDELHGDFEMGDYSYPASEVLYNVDYQAYEAENKALAEMGEE